MYSNFNFLQQYWGALAKIGEIAEYILWTVGKFEEAIDLLKSVVSELKKCGLSEEE